MFKVCPDCESYDYEKTGEKWSESGELYEVSVYICNKCGCEFDEEEAHDKRHDVEEFGD